MSGAPHADRRAADARSRQLAQTEFARPVAIEAGAGTGKTAILVARVLAWCLGPGWERALARDPGAEAARIAAWAASFAQRAEGERRPAEGFAQRAEGERRPAEGFAQRAEGEPRGDSALERAALALWRLPEAGT